MSSSPTRPSCPRKAASSRTSASPFRPSAAKSFSWTTWPSTSRPPAAPASSSPRASSSRARTPTRTLRKMLVENSLVAVISLPAGCFNPYSGVKTSILILDKSLAQQAQTIAFFKVENDGFGLGAQRRAIEKNDLPQVQAELAAYLQPSAQRPTHRRTPAHLRPDRPERKDRGQWRLQPERRAVSGEADAEAPHSLLSDSVKSPA